ncbi:MAG: ampD [Francisellaceae bacterium]|nr:ampD [Francisellaceae bacterium]
MEEIESYSQPNKKLSFINYPSPNFNQRMDKFSGLIIDNPTILVLHYTATPLPETLAIFSKPDSVSAHYTIDELGNIYKHVNEDKRAWHAGISYWNGITDVNTYALGIENINLGYTYGCFPKIKEYSL